MKVLSIKYVFEIRLLSQGYVLHDLLVPLVRGYHKTIWG